MESGSMCIDTRLFDDFFRDNNNLQKSFMDFLKYVYTRDSSMVEKNKDGKIVAVCAEIDIEANIDCDIACDGIVFKEKVKFDKCEFKGKVSFKNCTFKKQVIFLNSSFEDNVYFNNSTFEDYADFHECEFEKVACFYGVKFKKCPNLSACYFKEQKAVNLVNIDINSLDFKKVEYFIDDNYCKDKAYQEDQSEKKEQKYKLRYAQNAKDSFRIIKDVLIEQNNILEAQEWHKLELYAREKELEISLEKNNPIQSSSKLEKKEKFKKITLALVFNAILIILNNIKDKIGYFIEHIPIFFGCLLFCCILFSMLLFGLIMQLVIDFFATSFYITLNLLIQENFLLFMTRFIKYKTIKIYRIGKNMRDFTTWMNFALLYIYRNTSDHHTNFVKILNFTVGMIALYGATFYLFYFCFDMLMYSIIFFIPFIYFALALLILCLFLSFNSEKSYKFSILIVMFWSSCFILSIFLHSHIIHIEMFFIYILFIFLFYHLFTCKIKLIVFTLRLVSYLGLLYIIIAHHQFINPFIGIFSNDKLFESKFEQKLSDLNSSTIINLAKISQKEFTLQDDFNVSFAELNSAKMVVLSNKNNITALKDENLTKAAEILGDALYSEISEAIEQDRILGDIIKSTSVIYGIILLLCIFSLQKTARKNSIIPS